MMPIFESAARLAGKVWRRNKWHDYLLPHVRIKPGAFRLRELRQHWALHLHAPVRRGVTACRCVSTQLYAAILPLFQLQPNSISQPDHGCHAPGYPITPVGVKAFAFRNRTCIATANLRNTKPL
jgi:hypothetical protein